MHPGYRRAMRSGRNALLLHAALASGCACGALSHEADASSDASVLDAARDTSALDTYATIPPDALVCWARCSREGSRITGTARLDGEDEPLVHALVSTSHWFAVYTIVSLMADDECESEGRVVVSLELEPTEGPRVGTNTVRVHTSAGEVGTGSIDLSAWEPQSAATGPSGRLAGRLLVELPTVALDVTVDVSLCEDESSL